MVSYPVPLLLWSERHHPVLAGGIAKRGEDAASYAKIRMAMVSMFDGAVERQRNSSKAGRCHAKEVSRLARDSWRSLVREPVLESIPVPFRGTAATDRRPADTASRSSAAPDRMAAQRS